VHGYSIRSAIEEEKTMRALYRSSGTGIGFTSIPAAAFAAQLEQVQTAFNTFVLYAVAFFVIVVALYAYFMRLQDKRRAPVGRLFGERETIHSVGPDTPVNEAVRKMSAERIGALIVMDGEKLAGIFTERDALNKVLAAGLDPVSTKISAVMTRDPVSITPATTVGEAMEVVTKRRFRHLPIVENGKVLAVVSSGDLTHWLVKEKVGEVQELVDLAARP
jgi:CBS domain-containing protein